MTGYGRAEVHLAALAVVIEMKSVNHRFAEIVLRFPRELFALEDRVRKLILEQVTRGRIEVYVSLNEQHNGSPRRVEIDHALLEAAVRVIKEVSGQGYVDFEAPSVGHLLALPGLFLAREETPAYAELETSILAAVRASLQELVGMRRKEGDRLREHLQLRFADLRNLWERMHVAEPMAVSVYRERLAKRLAQVNLPQEVDAGRLAIEVAMIAERTSVEEELNRLDSHLRQCHGLLSSEMGPVGRKLDFLLQEMNREINTIGAKCADLAITEVVLSAKHVLEQMREQAQNVE